MSSNMVRNSPIWLNIASDIPPRGPKTAPRRFQVPAEPSKDPSERPEWLQNLKKINVFGLLAFSLPMGCGSVKMAPRWPKRAPRGAQEGPERAPREPKSAPRPPREGPPTPFLSFGGGVGDQN